MRRIKIWDRGERGGVGIKTFKTVEITVRDYRLMRAVVRAAETPVRVATMADIVHASMLTGLARALDAFNAPEKRK